MKVRVEPGNISGIIAAPPSKSMTQRAYAAALLHRGKTIIHNAGRSDDENAALQIIQQLGANVILHTDVPHLQGVAHLTEIESNGINPISGAINCGESGLAARLFTPIAALSAKEILIKGRGSLLQRPMGGFAEVLPALNIDLSGFNGFVPFSIKGPLQARSVKVDGTGGSQFLSGLLFALAYVATGPITIEVRGLKSIPYIDLTLEVLAHFGKPVTHDDHTMFYIDPAFFINKGTVEMKIEADWSSAAFLLVAGAIAGNISVQNLQVNSTQADRAILDILKDIGAEISMDNDSISVKRSPLQAFEFDATHCPDLFPVLSVLAACCDGESYVKGVHRLFHKESNRAESISEMLQDFDVPFSLEDDMLCITGVKKLQGTIINSYNDHRIVMAAAVGALRANGPVDILQTDAVNKSYPGFFNDLILCGGRCILAIK
jgi:3-phosphoshikimate 1-carboxyvinyltransferase